MKAVKFLPISLAVTALAFSNVSYADSDEVMGELMEVEQAIADSEAAKTEAAEMAQRAAKEKKESQSMRDKASVEMKRAQREEERARDRIALNEKKILAAQDEIEKSKKDMEDSKELVDKMKLEMEKSQADLENINKEVARYRDLRKEALLEKENVKKDYKKALGKVDELRKSERAALKDLQRAEAELVNVREKAKQAYAEGNKDSREYIRIIDEHRESVKRIAKKLDELEVEIEVDKAYEEKKERKQVAVQRNRTLASLKIGKFAKITSPACNIRSFPSSDSKVIGTYKLGRKVHVKIHDKSWYTTVYNGEKVFMGSGCFE
ncbi:MAG: hypothetical protein H6623_01285 [Bdellovibrionaceae bacterium]|nr:hypothetical protein [Pseudobdellovibrionaceae bacterium]